MKFSSQSKLRWLLLTLIYVKQPTIIRDEVTKNDNTDNFHNSIIQKTFRRKAMQETQKEIVKATANPVDLLQDLYSYAD